MFDKIHKMNFTERVKYHVIIVVGVSFMKIDRLSILPVGGIQPPNKVGKVEKNHNPSSGQDEVKVSSSGQVFQKLLEKAQKLPAVREDKVKIYQEQISRGEFDINSKSIAASLLSQKTEGK